MNPRRFLENVGHTPLVSLDLGRVPGIDLLAKLEFYNPLGSVKDRAAAYVLESVLRRGVIDKDTWIVESSSGNMGVALAAYSRYHGLRFRCVVDPRISAVNEMLIRSLGATVVKVEERDATGGYLLTRIEQVREFLGRTPNTYWTDQYANPLVADAYYHTLGAELCDALERIDYLFVAVSSGGTIAGLSRRVKERFPACRVVGVDSHGSLVFGGPACPRFIPGIGSSMVPESLKTAQIDDVVVVDEGGAVDACHRLLAEHGIFAGGSSGFVVAAIERYFAARPPEGSPAVVAILPDRGDRYAATVYNPEWCAKLSEGVLGAEEQRKPR
jgi:cysteine synthase A